MPPSDVEIEKQGMELCKDLRRRRPAWVKGSLSVSDGHFLMQMVLRARTSLAVEVGTASGFSTAVLGAAMNLLYELGVIADDYKVRSFDITRKYFADRSRTVGDATRELLPPDLLKHIDFVNPASAIDIALQHPPGSIKLLFIDANHRHPWPTLDLLAALDALAPGATVLMHDINLPLLHPHRQKWGVKHLFDSLQCDKSTPTDVPVANTGAVHLPSDRDAFRQQLLVMLKTREWEGTVPPKHLRQLGLDAA